jgi:hypothetical protein
VFNYSLDEDIPSKHNLHDAHPVRRARSWEKYYLHKVARMDKYQSL